MAKKPMKTPGKRGRTWGPQRTARRRTNLHTRQLGFELAIFDPASRQVHILNPLAAVIWNHITPDRTVKNIAEVIALAYFRQANPHLDEITDDVVWILGQFEQQGLLLASDEKERDAARPKDVTIHFPDREIGAIGADYVRPNLRTYTLDQLEDKFQLEASAVAPFADTWNPYQTQPSAAGVGQARRRSKG